MEESRQSNLEVVLVHWIDALRRHDLEAVAAGLDPAVVWQGAREDLVCSDREAVLDALRSQVSDPDQVEAVELIGARDRVMLGVRSPQLQEVAGVPFDGQSFTVFTLRGGKIVHMEDHLRRADAVAAAGVSDLAGWR